ncbi:MAG: 23S rRNA pseudouridine(1911/1915/1917) synthase RluD [Rhodocyclaceae bacterium]|jgi:23S rRNA pseudouridine1911/1915/1917 synthase|nr:23S rRNA pseudouridine(1911/1915/1917) synthase RluD [Rhodocyclaceae bacterium]
MKTQSGSAKPIKNLLPEALEDLEDNILNDSTLHRVAADGGRLDQVLADCVPEHSRNRLQQWVKAGRVDVDGKTVTEPKYKIYGGESLAIRVDQVLTEAEAGQFQPEVMDLPIVYEDDQILVINKPPGLVVHPAAGNWQGTLLNGLLAHDPVFMHLPRAGIVHRLDKDTSGLMVVARTLAAHTHLVRQLQARSVKRLYRAVVCGVPKVDGTVNAPIGRDPRQRIRMAVTSQGKEAITHYRLLEVFPGCSLVECTLETGRTHQIRVHMAHLGHPLVGDETYLGGRRHPLPEPAAQFGRQALHARQLGLIHPETGEPMRWTAQVPADMGQLLEDLRDLAGEA